MPRTRSSRISLRRGQALKKHAKAMFLSGAAAAALALSTAPARADAPTQLSWDKPVRCMTNEKGAVVRVQCETRNSQLVCLVAPNESP